MALQRGSSGSMNVGPSTCAAVPVRLFSLHAVSCASRWNVAVIADPPRRRAAGQVATCGVTGDKSRSTKSYGCMVKGSQFE